MNIMAQVMTGLVALLHVVFMILESFLWTTPAGRRIFAQSVEDAEKTKVLALNQGCYNGGAAALLVWAMASGRPATVAALLVFIIAMGVVGAITAKPTIILLQALPAAVALPLVLL